jgi:hypothetical protein
MVVRDFIPLFPSLAHIWEAVEKISRTLAEIPRTGKAIAAIVPRQIMDPKRLGEATAVLQVRPMTPESEPEEQIQAGIVQAADALDAEKELFYEGAEGPYVLEGTYSLPVFERLARESETSWKLSYCENSHQISLYGDSSFAHETLHYFIQQLLFYDLMFFIGASEAPRTGLAILDSARSSRKCDVMLWPMGATTRVLVPSSEEHRQTLHPTDSARDGTIHKAADQLMTVSPVVSATGREMDLIAIEVAFQNEGIATVAWEAQRWAYAQTPARIAISFKIQVRFPSICYEI